MRKFKLAGACFALLSVVLGAFASHFLKSYLDIQKFDAFETGIRYMMYHGLSMLIIGGFEIPKNILIFRLFFWGTILFSFSIFLLCLQKFFSTDLSFLAPVTPLGGTLLISAWIILILRILKIKAL
ncbi:MAG: hypothetical protein CMC78_04415 [Flavobacteriaceae bacterium]|nr:hypothetical protein [Flavobacteriaceae bacterium]|tara:strand:+ start:4798 stop:5175 length:378 start_codon:yes stop_codon:yes gene_type:complete